MFNVPFKSVVQTKIQINNTVAIPLFIILHPRILWHRELSSNFLYFNPIFCQNVFV